MKSILQRLKINDESEIAVPVFDRVAEISRGSARIISSNTPIILVEGNYLLLNEKPWNILWNYFNFTVMISTPLDEIKSQLMNRWLELGFSFEEATIRVQENDLKNIQTVIQKSRKADFIIHRGKR
jgi:pantothenate kinase